jgi:hypothetical protein
MMQNHVETNRLPMRPVAVGRIPDVRTLNEEDQLGPSGLPKVGSEIDLVLDPVSVLVEQFDSEEVAASGVEAATSG